MALNNNSYAQAKKYFIYFTDKNNTPYSLSQPQSYLSQRAIDRRTRQNIAITSNDLPVNPVYVDSIKKIGANVILRSKWLNGVAIETADLNLLNTINNLGFVKSSKLVNRLVKGKSIDKFAFDFQNLSLRNSLVSSTTFDYGSSFTQNNQIGCDCMHQQGFTGKGMLIAVLDAGFPAANTVSVFDSARAENRISTGFDFVDNNVQIFDDHPHGTYVLSCMASLVNGQIIGTAPHASYVLIRTEDAPTEHIIEEYNWVAGAEFADSVGADIINSSLGYTQFDDPSQNHTYQDMDGDHTIAAFGADIAASKGIFVNISAGNSGNSPWYYISTPADADSALAIGALDASGNVAGFSSRGPAPDGAVKPNVMAMGVGTTVVDPADIVTTGSGTSFAGPVNAGAVACLWQSYPQATNMQLKAAIEQSASIYNNPNGDYGYGIPNYCLAKSLLTGIDPRKLYENEPLVYPNPFLNEINVNIYSGDTQTINISIYDIAGKMIFTQQHKLGLNSYNNLQLELPGNLSAGTYSVTVNSDKINFRKKLMKILK
jgi:hypothetical protein